ncbi:hypothetical protein SDJN02_26634, partial [Cucurbita argyrosperma subsp. argyrosperma]
MDVKTGSSHACSKKPKIALDAFANQNLESQQESLGTIRFGNTLKFVGKISQTTSWNGDKISMKTCKAEEMARLLIRSSAASDLKQIW